MPNRLSHCRSLDLQLRPDGGAEAVFDQIVTTPWGRALLHPHCPPGSSSHASHAYETAWVCVSNIPLYARFCDNTTPIARVMQLLTSLPSSHLPLWSLSQASAMMTSCSL